MERVSDGIQLFDRVALARDVPEEGLLRGDVAVVVDRVHAADTEDGYVLEIFNAVGDSIRVVDVPVSAVAPLTADEILTVRPLAHSA